LLEIFGKFATLLSWHNSIYANLKVSVADVTGVQYTHLLTDE